jgi:MFS transporter, PHS family, inorganic phosphate transporter
VSFLFIDSWGRKPIQLMGFTLLTAIFVVMGMCLPAFSSELFLTASPMPGFAYNVLNKTSSGRKWFVFLYCLANFFQNFGPNTTTFIVPGEVFPTRYRSTAHGISAASGKLGAVVAQVGFARLRNIHGPNKFINHMYVPSSLTSGFVGLTSDTRLLQSRNFCLVHADWNFLHPAYPGN